MKAKRIKQQRKTMQLYAASYGFREPYQILADADFCLSCATQDIDAESRLHTALNGQVKIMITQCCVSHLYKLGPPSKEQATEQERAIGDQSQAAVELARQWTRRKCGHWEAKSSSAECIRMVIGKENKHRYVVATQNPELREQLRKVPGVPIVYLNASSVLILELPSQATLDHRKSLESAKQQAELSTHASTSAASTTTDDANIVTNLESKSRPLTGHAQTRPVEKSAESQLAKKKKSLYPDSKHKTLAGAGKRKRPQPNPLSVKKKKSKGERPVAKKKLEKKGTVSEPTSS